MMKIDIRPMLYQMIGLLLSGSLIVQVSCEQSNEGLYNVRKVSKWFTMLGWECDPVTLCHGDREFLHIEVKTLCFINRPETVTFYAKYNDFTLGIYRIENINLEEEKKKDNYLQSFCKSMNIDETVINQDSIMFYNNGDWWCDVFRTKGQRRRFDKCDVTREESAWLQTDYQSASYYDIWNDENKIFLDTERRILCSDETTGVLFEAKFPAYKPTKFYVRASINGVLIHYFKVNKKTNEESSPEEKDLETSCRLFHTRVEEKGGNINKVYLQYFNEGGWLCMEFQKNGKKFKKNVLGRNYFYYHEHFTKALRFSYEKVYAKDCKRFNDYKLPEN